MPRTWDRRKNEAPERFAAFVVYRDMGPRERSHKLVAEELGVQTSLIHRWSSEDSWVQRAMAWDDHLDLVRQQEFEDQARVRVMNIIKTGEAYAGAFAKRMQAVLEALQNNEPIPEDAPPLNAQGFVAVSRMIVDLSGVNPDPSTGGDSVGQIGRNTASLTADDLIAATQQLVAAGRPASRRDVILAALARKYGTERIGLPGPVVDVHSEAETPSSEVIDEQSEAPSREAEPAGREAGGRAAGPQNP